MAGEEAFNVVKLLAGAGGSTVLALASYLWFTGRIVTRWAYDEDIAYRDKIITEEKKRGDAWQQLALDLLFQNQKAVETNEKLVLATEKIAEKVPVAGG